MGIGNGYVFSCDTGCPRVFSLRKNDAQGLKLPGVILAGLLPLVAVQHPTYQEFAGIAFGLVLFGAIVFLILVMCVYNHLRHIFRVMH